MTLYQNSENGFALMNKMAASAKKPPEPLGQCDSNFIGMFQTVRFIQMMSLTFGLFTQVSGSGHLGPLVYWCHNSIMQQPFFF